MAKHECRHAAASHQCWCARGEDHDAPGYIPEHTDRSLT